MFKKKPTPEPEPPIGTTAEDIVLKMFGTPVGVVPYTYTTSSGVPTNITLPSIPPLGGLTSRQLLGTRQPTTLTGYQQQMFSAMLRALGHPGFSDTLATPPEPVDPATLEKSTDQFYGWRVFSLRNGYSLTGSHRAKWESKTLSATCKVPLSPSVDEDTRRCLQHLANQTCACGIYSHRGVPEYLDTSVPSCDQEVLSVYAPIREKKHASVVASSLSHGVVASYEFGFRSSECTLERLWLVRPRKCRAGHQQVLQKDTMTWGCGDSEDHAEVAAISLQMNYGVPCSVAGVLDFLKELEG